MARWLSQTRSSSLRRKASPLLVPSIFDHRDTNRKADVEDDTERQIWQHTSLKALECLANLVALQLPQKELPIKSLIILTAYTNPLDVWNSTEPSQVAIDLLGRHGEKGSSNHFITHDLLQDFIRPLFRNSRPDTVTAEGRKVTTQSVVDQRFSSVTQFDPVKKPWKYDDIYATTVLKWALQTANV